MNDRVIPHAGPDEVVWLKSSYSGGEGNECVEIADFRSVVALRDSKALSGPIVGVTPEAFVVFLDGVKGSGPARTV